MCWNMIVETLVGHQVARLSLGNVVNTYLNVKLITITVTFLINAVICIPLPPPPLLLQVLGYIIYSLTPPVARFVEDILSRLSDSELKLMIILYSLK